MKKSDVRDKTDIWQKYEKCKEYADKKSIVSKTERNWNFYIGNQWKGLKSGGEDLPMMNFIKPIVQYKVSSVAQNAMTAVYNRDNTTTFTYTRSGTTTTVVNSTLRGLWLERLS